jgi:NAD-dependent deacetylase
MAPPSLLSAADCAALIRKTRRVAALTGAGISTAAGIPDFRGPQGLYVTRRYDPETVFDISYFRRDPVPFYDFTRDFLGAIDSIEPTFSHRFLAGLEAQGRLAAVITQNIDSLHQKAGSRRVISVHGDYWSSRCLRCGRLFDLAHMQRAVREAPAPHCPCGGLIKPDVVFFGEVVNGLEEAAAVVADCELLLVLGSSLDVYPAAFLPSYATGEVVVVNRGAVGLPPGPRRHFVDAELDAYLAEVEAALGGGGPARLRS